MSRSLGNRKGHDIRADGAAAFKAGAPLESNPYGWTGKGNAGPGKAQRWAQGWRRAKLAAEQSKTDPV